MTEMDELKPCQFCGYAPTGEEELLDILDVDEFGEKVEKIKYVGVSCAGCCAYVPVQTHDKTEAIAAWNRRPTLSPAGVTEEQVEAALKAKPRNSTLAQWLGIAHVSEAGARELVRSALEAAAKARSVGVEDAIPCEDCGAATPSWNAPNELWNLVKGGPDAKDDPGGHLCLNCFVRRAEAAGIRPAAWHLCLPTPLEAAAKAKPSISTGQGEPVDRVLDDTFAHYRDDLETVVIIANRHVHSAAGDRLAWLLSTGAPLPILNNEEFIAGVIRSPWDRMEMDFPLYPADVKTLSSSIARLLSLHPSLPAGHVAVPVEAMVLLEEILNEDAPNKHVWKTHESMDEWLKGKILPLLRTIRSALPHTQGEGK
jgi:hypothetical protein